MAQLTAQKEQQIREELSKRDYELGKPFGDSPKVFIGRFRRRDHKKCLIMFRYLDVPEEKNKFDQEMLALIELKKSTYLKNPYVVDLFDSFTSGRVGITIVEFFHEGGNLSELITANPGGLTEELSARFYLQIGYGLAYVHSKGIAHKDIQPANVFLDITKTVAKLTNFDKSTFCYRKNTGEVTLDWPTPGTMDYLGPEYCQNSPYHLEKYQQQKSDIWSMGVIMFEMVYGIRPFQFEHQPNETPENDATRYYRKMICNVTSIPWTEKQTSKAFVKFVLLHFDHNPKLRPEINDLLYDIFLEKGMSCPAMD